MKATRAIKKYFKSLEIFNIFKLLIKINFIIILFLILSPYKAIANIFELNCKNSNNSVIAVYSFKRNSAVITSINGTETKVKFTMIQKTNSSFKSEGIVSKIKTSLEYKQNTKELAMLQSSLRGSNIFLKCEKPKLLKEE